MIRFFEEALIPGWVYPCTLDEVRGVLSRLPDGDLEGLRAVGLRAATRKYHSANGTYWYDKGGSSIALWSTEDGLRHRMSRHAKYGRLMRGLSFERAFGAEVEEIGSRFEVGWTPENLRDFILYHVLLHEVGHHVQFRQREPLWKPRRLPSHHKEQFAEAYAARVRAEFFPEIQGSLPRGMS